ncbi:MAG: ABC transporter ATP-binding protein [Prevotellaceae bacterium]|jgi:ABC-type lipoprotein export system ATPase subunit|nr:ABC transporter ATP-binding protein [Prevotellaceae bacterium]
MVQLSGITKSYPDGERRLNRVLCGVDMSISPGDFVAVKGASGSGKTTLLAILGTLLAPDSGSYLLNGQEMTAAGVDRSAVRNRHIGFVFQEHRLLPQYSALENILLPTLAFASRSSREQLDYARRLMDVTGIAGVAAQHPPTLSGGEASRVALCRALIMKPLLLLADEPTAQLDAKNALNIAALLLELSQSLRTAVVMATHADEVAQAAKKTLHMEGGKIIISE